MAGHEVPRPVIPEEFPLDDDFEDEKPVTRAWLRLYWSWGWLLWLAGLVVAIIVLVIIGMTLSDRDDRACRAHGHQVVNTGIGDGQACVDSEWKVVKP